MVREARSSSAERQPVTVDSLPSSQPREQVNTAADQRVWILRRHPRVTLREAHAIVAVDWNAGVARCACGLGLRPEEIDDVPAGGCMPCPLCVKETPLPASIDD
jgi:hypothetical protein